MSRAVKRGWWLLLVLSLVGLGGCEAYRNWSGPGLPQRGVTAPLRASGVIQAQQISVASELGGVIATMPVREGQAVVAGEVVAQLDTALLDGQLAVAEARLAWAEAGLRQAEAGAREGQIAVAEAQLAQAHAGLRAAGRAVTDTQALMATPQELDLQIVLTRGQLASARHAQARAGALKDSIEVAKLAVDRAREVIGVGGRQRFGVSSGSLSELLGEQLPPELVELLPDDLGEGLEPRTITHRDYELYLGEGRYELYVWRDLSLPLDAQLLPNTWWQAWVGVHAATARVEGLESRLGRLVAERAAPQTLAAQVDEARALEAAATEQVRLAQVQVDGLRAGLTAQELAVIEAQVGQARAAVQALRLQREMLSLTSPITGTVIRILLREHEVAAQGAPLLTVADLRDLRLTVYVPERRLGDVWIDQEVEVRVDSFPQRRFMGRVTTIADRAEFTPRNVATEEERESLVFGIEIRIDNPEGVLKPGMPADALFAEVAP
jgi:multidrug resistance efflux pump